MAQTIELSAELRTAHGKGATRRLRRLEAKVPAVIYGGGKEPRSIALGFFEVTNASHHESLLVSNPIRSGMAPIATRPR